MELLKLAALDAEDLAILSAHLQDAVLRPQDLAYLASSHRFVLVGRRFDWSTPDAEAPRRRLTGLHFERVMAVRARGLTPGSASDEPLNLLAITFEPKEDPSGTVTLVFAGKAAIQLDVECIEARLKDLGPVWEVEGRPDHEAAEAGRAAILGQGNLGHGILGHGIPGQGIQDQASGAASAKDNVVKDPTGKESA